MGLVDAVESARVGPVTPAPSAASTRLRSLDIMRGIVVVGMIVVNAMAYSNQTYGFDAFSILTHSPWAGFTFADFVFPAFIFMAGISVAVSLREVRAADGAGRSRISTRALRLLVLGFFITNIPWVTPVGDWRWLGVLQRIGICYFAVAILYRTTGWRTRAAIALLVLLLYWPLTLLPMPDGSAVDLLKPGANFISWVDRAFLGTHAFSTGAGGYDPEGLLSTLPAIAQCLLGTLAGEWLLARRHSRAAMAKLAMAGAAGAGIGLAWSPLFPIVKNIWTSSFVLLSTGVAAMLLAALVWLLDQKRATMWGATFFEAFGINAILAYVLHQLAQFVPAGDSMHSLSLEGTHASLSQLMAFLPVVAFLALLWLPLEYMRRRHWIVKI
ncbi:MAG TPA: heparan-alpha-glucosaminide N-acetyltransferase domain-containing protein [Rhizomicrobium sp.]